MGLSQAELARRLSKTRSLLSYIEKTGKVSDLTYFEIMVALGVTLDKDETFGNSRLAILQESKPEYFSKISEVEHLRKENSSLKEIIQLQKSLITLLEKQSGR